MNLLPPQGFGPEAKTRGGIIGVPAYSIFVSISIRKNLDLPTIGAQGGIGNCREHPQVGIGRCIKCLHHVYIFLSRKNYQSTEFACTTLINI